MNLGRKAIIALNVAKRVYEAELRHSRMVGADALEAFCSASRALDETYFRAFETERPAVWPRGAGPGGT
jgi:hypothetical protein